MEKEATKQRIIKHLREIEEQTQVNRSKAYNYRQNRTTLIFHWHNVILFGKHGYWFDKKNKTGPPPGGYRISILHNHSNNDDNKSTYSQLFRGE
jgi:hypothetical protein